MVFLSCLKNRQQRVKYENCVSGLLPVLHGVPQGTVLGPLLFLLYINDMVRVVKNCEVELFADDAMIYCAGKDITTMQQIVNKDLDDVFNWLCNNKLNLTASKSRFYVNDITILINNQKIVYEAEVKYLEVLLDKCLNFQAHADYITRKFSKKVNFISRVGKHLSSYTKKMLYNSIAAPHIEFCATLLYGLSAYKIEQLQMIQNRAMRAILKFNRYTHISTMLTTLNMLPVKQKIMYNVVVEKVKNV